MLVVRTLCHLSPRLAVCVQTHHYFTLRYDGQSTANHDSFCGSSHESRHVQHEAMLANTIVLVIGYEFSHTTLSAYLDLGIWNKKPNVNDAYVQMIFEKVSNSFDHWAAVRLGPSCHQGERPLAECSAWSRPFRSILEYL